jgi:hypothetical protein
MPGPLVSEGPTALVTQANGDPAAHSRNGPAALVDDTFAAREGHVSPYAHRATLTEGEMSNRTLVIWFLLVAAVFGAIMLYAVFQGRPA